MSVEKAAKAECITETMLKQYLDGTLCENSAGELERHIQDCDTCRRLMVSVMDSCAQPMWVSMLGLANRSDIDTASTPARTGRISDTRYLTTKACDEESPNRFANFPVLPGFAPVRRLGSGSTGEVWEVEDVLLGRAVAVKWLRHASPSAVDVQRLLNEAQALARLRHPGIVRILEVSTRDQPAIVMDLVRGPSLAEKINGRAIGEREAAKLVAELADAIQHAHEHAVIHRDLKPSNILLQLPLQGDSTGDLEGRPLSAYRPLISDFGTARLADSAGITFQGQLLGTPAYMAPEQIAGDASLITPAVDIYSLGVILYELLTGRPPYVTTSAEATLQLVRQAEPLSPRELQPLISADIETVCLKCLSREPRDRYVSAAALKEDLLRFVSGQPVIARPPGLAGRLIRWTRRNRSLALSLGMVFALLFVITLQSVLFGFRQQELVKAAAAAEVSAKSSERLAKAAEQQATQSADGLRQQLVKAVSSMDEMVEVFGGLDAHDQTISEPAKLQFFNMAIQFYQDYLVFSYRDGLVDPADAHIVVRVNWLRERVQPGTADEQDLAWAAKVLEQKQQSEGTAEFLDLQARHTEVLAMHATAKGQHTEAASAWRKVADVIEQLAVMGNPLPAKLHRHYRLRAAILMNCAGQQLAAGEYPLAIEAVREALDVLGKIPADDADHAVDVIRSIEYSIPLAQMQLGLGQRSRAVATIEKSKLRLSEKAFVDPRLQAVADGLKMRLEQLRAEVTGEPAGLAP